MSIPFSIVKLTDNPVSITTTSALTPRGAYSGGTAYVPFDLVSYNGSSYLCIVATTGNLPTNTTYWQLFAQQGNEGPSTVSDSVFTIYDNVDPTKQVQFQASSLTTGTTRTLTVQDATGTLALLSNRLDQFAAPNTDLSMGSHKITNVTDPASAQDAATKSYVDTAVTGLLDYKGATDCSANPNYPAASKGDVYVVSVAGKIGGASGVTVDAGDMFFAKADNAGGTDAAVGSSWDVVQANLVRAVTGPTSSTDGYPAIYNGTGGTVIKDSKVLLTQPATGSTLTVADGKTLTASNTVTLAGTDGVSMNLTNNKKGSFGITADGAGVTLTTGVKGFCIIPCDGTITGWYITSDASGSITWDVWKTSGAEPTVSNTITASAKPSMTTNTYASSTTLTGWTTAVSAGDVIGFNIDSISGMARCTLTLTYNKT